jgi:hypothetical protein
VDAMKDAKNFQERFSKDVKKEVTTMEQDIYQKRSNLFNLQLEIEFKDWVPDTGYSRSRDTKVFNLVELY